jgi:hypothetical protein
MLQENGDDAWLDAVLGQLVQTAPRVEALLARHFPGSGGALYPDAAGNVCVTENAGSASARPASVYARCVAKLGKLVEAFCAAAIDQAAAACIRLAKERTVFACALDLARHPLNPMQRQLFIARMMPSTAPLHRQDDATASCIWLRLWTLHAWVLELRLALALTGGAARPDQTLLQSLDGHLSRLLQPDAYWLCIELCTARAAAMVARAPMDVLPVGHLAWPNRLGALLPEGVFDTSSLGRAGIGLSEEDGHIWLRFGNRFAEVPNLVEARTRLWRDTQMEATRLCSML